MNFVSFAFLYLLVPLFILRLFIGKFKTEPVFVAALIAASTLFCAWHVPAYFFVMLFVIVADYWIALWMSRFSKFHRARKWLLWLSIVSNAGVLVFFKYTDFFSSVVADCAGWAGIHISPIKLELALPMGISFYTFCAMSYTIDVYRGRLQPVQKFKELYFFLTFFPHLVAGPIVRAEQFLYQIPRRRRLSVRVFNEAAWLLARGYFLKMVCADNLAEVVNEKWNTGYDQTNGSGLWLLAFSFSIQIFCDFEGYSSIARGLAYLFGYRLPANFNHPYIATSFTDFWRRWHITLSEWLRDYFFIPVGVWLTRGRFKCGSVTAGYLATLLTFGTCGLWHGANLTYVAWGLMHGVMLCAERWIGLNPSQKTPWPVRLSWTVVVQVMILVAWVLFRSDSIWHACAYLVHAIAGLHFEMPEWWSARYALYLLPPVMMHVFGWLVERRYCTALTLPSRAVLAGGMALLTLTLYTTSSEFIYFKF